MANSPDLGIPYVPSPPPAQAEVLHNEALNMLIALQKGAIDRGLDTPPGSPADGDVYIVGAAPTGAWVGKANKIAIYTGTAWTFVPGNDSDGADIPIGARHEGLQVWVQDEDALYVWSGSAWAIFSAGVGWDLAGSWTHSGDVANVDFTGLGGYSELMVICRNIPASVAGTRMVRVSTDGGSSFYSTTGDYVLINSSGVESDSSGFPLGDGSSSARSGVVPILNNMGDGTPPVGISHGPEQTRLFVASGSTIDALRVANTTGGNLTGGSIVVLGRV